MESKQEIDSLSNIECLEDGPLFRATINDLESRTATLKTRLKRIIKAVGISLEARKQMTKADEELMETLREVECVEPLMSHYLNDAWSKIIEERRRLDHSLSFQLLEPMKNLYEQDIKAAELKRRQFEEESKDYYAVLAKYLKRTQNEEKQLTRKLKFDLARFDYLGFLVDLHGGRKEHDILLHITNHIVRELNYFESTAQNVASVKPGLDLLVALLSENSLKYSIKMTERANKRKELESMIIQENPDRKRRTSISDTRSSCTSSSSVLSAEIDPSVIEDKFKGIRDLEQTQGRYNSLLGRKKEGFLFATSKPSKSSGFDVKSSTQTWHKYWCVLSGGQLYEYTNWKKQLEPHNGPINLRFATVREARNSERRFCFEVITPLMRRIYQATSQEEAEYWMSTIQNSIESVLNGTSSYANLKSFIISPSTSTPIPKTQTTTMTSPALTNNKKKRSSRHVRSLSVVLKSVAADKHPNVESNDSSDKSLDVPCLPTGTSLRSRWSGFHFGNYTKPPSSSNHDQNNITTKPSSESFYAQFDIAAIKELLDTLRLDPSNHFCADCGAKDPDWCSLNLGILLCIECSGIHRSLGTHISKVRSLKLDSACYTSEVIEYLKCMGNAQANAIWDPRLTQPSSITSNREERLTYIQAKYVDHAFADKENTLNQLLFEAVHQDDTAKAMYALELIRSKKTKMMTEKEEREKEIEPSLKDLVNLNYVAEENVLDMIAAPS
ncbi:hypothetical protein G6F62_003368 [Rhizopus arrhizus]|nr:hypothetical protein G6F62_003368 [Rhizopus arrhizus]